MRYYTLKTPWLIKKIYPGLIWDKKQESERCLYLTFDDGPIPEVTPWVIDQLALRDIQATFFVVGKNVEDNPEILSELIKAGHKIGNHTYNHLNGWESDFARYFDDFKKCQESIDQHTKTNLFRPPYGKIKRAAINEISKTHQIIMWDYLIGDFDKLLSVDKIYKSAISKVRHGSIVVFHDSLKAEKHLRQVLPGFLDHFLELGYKFKTL